MPKPRVSAADGFAALAYTFKKGREAGGVFKLYKRMPVGNLAMYYPEVNAVVPRRVDPESGTPAFKSILARPEPVRR